MSEQFSIFVGTEEEADALAKSTSPYFPAAVRTDKAGALWMDNPERVVFAIERGGFFGNTVHNLRGYELL
jgi:hypothetical protein